VEHLVARCPVCERPIWAKQVAKLLGFAVKARRYTDLGFVAVTRGKGQGRGWRVKEPLRSLLDVARVGGVEAVAQLRKLARQAFARMWLQGLLQRDDVEAVMATTTLQRPQDAPKPPLDVAAYVPGSRVSGARPTPAMAPAAPPSKPPLLVEPWKP
jgi:hypothetical protein